MPRFLIGRRRVLFAFLLALSFAQVAFAVAAAGAVSRLFAEISRGGALGLSAVAQLIAAIIAIGLAELGRRWSTEALGLGYARDVRMALFERLLRRPFRGGTTRSRGSVLLPFVGDLTALRQWSADGLARGVSSAVIAAGLCLILVWQQPALGLALAALLAVSLACIAVSIGPYARATRRQRRQRGIMTGLISDRIAGAHSVFALGGLQRELRRVDSRIAAMNRAALRRAQWSGAMRAIAAAAPLAGTLATLLVAARLTGSGTMEAHNVVGSLTLVGLIGGCIGDLVRAAELAIPARISRQRIEARLAEIQPLLMREPRRPQDARSRKVPPLRIQGVKLEDAAAAFTASAGDGDIVLVDGEPGSGKSTLLASIAGFHRVPAGLVLSLGHAAARLPQRLRREGIGYGGGAAPLLQAMLAENLGYRVRSAEHIREVATLMRELGLAHRIDPDGAIARLAIRDGGQGLPGAEAQAIQIVRALVGRPRLLVLDDVFDALGDAEAARVARLLGDWPGLVVVATRHPLIRAVANRCWRIDSAGIVEVSPDRAASADIVPLSPRLKA